VLLLFQTGFDYASVDFFLEDELEVIVGVGLPITNEVEMVEGADESDSKLLEFSVDAVLEVAEGHVELNVVEFVEVED
jgi:hypothetical protein